MKTATKQKRRDYMKKYLKEYMQRNYSRLHPQRMEYQKEYRSKNRDKVNAQSLSYYHCKTLDQKAKIRESARNRYKEMRLQIIKHYGGKCVCCGEQTYEFLALNHVNGGGTKERKSMPIYRKLYKIIIKENYPDKYNLMCHNCNSSYGYYKYCPHQKHDNI